MFFGSAVFGFACGCWICVLMVPGVGGFDGLNCLCSVCLFRRCCLGLGLWLV